MPPLSSSTPVRRSSPRLALPADGNCETAVCLSSSKPCYSTRRSLKQAAANGRIILKDGYKDSTSLADAGVYRLECRHHRRNSAIKNSRSSRSLHSVTEGTNLLSSRWSAVSDEELNDSRPGISEPAVDQLASLRRKRGWPKGLPRKKQVR